MTTTINVSEGFTVNQVLSSDGFTLDTTDFIDYFDDDEDELDYAKSVKLNNEEMMRFLNLEDDNDGNENTEPENLPFIGIKFDDLKPKMQSVYGDGEILKLIKKEGVGDVIPSDAQATVEYVGYFEYQDEPFDSTLFHREKQASLRLGKTEILQGLEIAISTMRKHEKALFIIQPHLAFGKLGCLPRIPPDAEVLFKIELINFVDNGSADLYEELSNEDKRKFSKTEKIIRNLMNTGQDSFKRGKFKQATRDYNKAVDCLEKARLENDEEEKVMNTLLQRALTNLTVCYNKINKPKLACMQFQKLPKEPSGKAHFQYGKALAQLGEYDKAMESLQKAKALVPNCEEIKTQIQEVEVHRQKYLEFSKRFAQNSFKLLKDKNEDMEEFEKVSAEMCDYFLKNNSAQKHKLPSGLSPQELECIRRLAAARDLSITKQNRLGTESLYLTKKAYYYKDSM